MASKAIINIMIDRPNWESNPGLQHCMQAHYQLSFFSELKSACFCNTYGVTVIDVKRKDHILLRNSVVSTPNILAKKSKENHCHTAKLEPYWRLRNI
jgi:hypothetical protein